MDDERALRDCFLRLLELEHESALRPRVNGLQTIGQEINLTSLIRHPGIEILVRLKASKKLKPPVPQDVECYAASQCLRRSKRDTIAVLRVWYRSSDA